MARPRSAKVTEIKARLQTRLAKGVYRDGDRFLSTRELASNFGISYQTAHRLIGELAEEGLLERRPASGTYIPGAGEVLAGIQLIFNERARRSGSFGARLLGELKGRLEKDRIPLKITWWSDGQVNFARDRFPVIWECPPAIEKCFKRRHAGLLLNDRPRPGLEAAFLDSVSIDDFSGGACAAQLLAAAAARSGAGQKGFGILSGPTHDERSNQRRDGFLSLIPGASVVAARSWFYEDGFRQAGAAIRVSRRGLFCCNDRLAEAVITHCREKEIACPPIVGFDDAPVAESLNLTTIAIPWVELISGAADLIKKRLTGDSAAARQLIFTPRPIVRNL
jgi:hypothetical protein